MLLDNDVHLYALKNIIGNFLHSIVFLCGVFVKGQYQRLLIKFMCLLEIGASQLKVVIDSVTNQVFDILDDLPIFHLHCAFIAGNFRLLHLSHRHGFIGGNTSIL